MKHSEKGLWNDFFSHVYVEEGAAVHPNTAGILNKLKNAAVIPVKHYKDVFSTRQNFIVQKNSQKLILALKSGNFFYRGSPMCPDYGFDDFYYVSQIMNCPYDCEYCYLQGLYGSANIVAFVNVGDTFDTIKKEFAGGKPFFCVSYDSDLLALENYFGFARKWIGFAAENKEFTFELRTKSANFSAIADMKPAGNFILAWTLSPDAFINDYEKKSPRLGARIENVIRAAEAGWKVRLCFDPLLYVPGCIETYKNFIANLFNELPEDKIFDVCLGPFRMPKKIAGELEKARRYQGLFSYPFVAQGDEATYREDHANELYGAILPLLPNIPVYSRGIK